jgi:hypothetical protein
LIRQQLRRMRRGAINAPAPEAVSDAQGVAKAAPGPEERLFGVPAQITPRQSD